MEFIVFAPLTNNLCNNSHALTWYELGKKTGKSKKFRYLILMFQSYILK